MYIYIFRSRYCNNVRLFSKIIKNTFFIVQIFRSHFGIYNIYAQKLLLLIFYQLILLNAV